VNSLKIEPYNEGGNYALAQFYLFRGLHYNAIKYLNRAIEVNPLYLNAYDARGAYYAELGDLNQAIADAEKSLEIAPEDVKALSGYALLLIQSNRISEAEENYKRLIKELEEQNPNDEWISVAKSFIHALRGEKEKAFEIAPGGNFGLFYIFKMADEIIEPLEKSERRKKGERSRYLELSNSHLYDFLRDDPRFQEILKEEKKLYDELLEKYPDVDL
jgi:tetratricopeptide (TPR) repeat protein